MSNTKLFFGLLLLTTVITGCASGVSRTQISDKAQLNWSAENPFGKMELVLTPSGKESIKDNLKFDPDVLKNHIERALAANSLIAEETEGRLPHLLIEVKDVRVRSNFSAVMWGFMAGDDHIVGDIVVKSPLGEVLDRFEVSASYALGGLAGGMDSARMGWLYETFAEEMLNELTKDSGGYVSVRTNAPVASQETVILSPVTQEPLEPRDDGDFRPGDLVLLEFNDGGTKVVTITDINEVSIAGFYDYEHGSYQISDLWDRSTIKSMKRAHAATAVKTSEPTQPKAEDIFKPGDVIVLEFNNGNTKEIILTHMNDRVIAGHYQYSGGHTTPVNYDRRDVRRISYAK